MSHVPPPKRHPYDQWSPDARALDLVGDKWTLLIVRDGEKTLSYCCTLAADGVTVVERSAGSPDARVVGSRADWIRALSPDGNRDGLQIAGNQPLAELLLENLGARRSGAARTTQQLRGFAPVAA